MDNQEITEELIKAADSAEFTTRRLRDVHSYLCESNPIAAELMLDYLSKASELEMKIKALMVIS